MSEYKDTLNLPRTAFPMKASLAQREPQRLKQWQEMDLYGKIRAASAPNRPPEHIGFLVEKQYRQARGGPSFHMYSITTRNRDEQIGHIDQLGRAWRYEKKAGCVFIGQQAMYLGPFEAVVDEEGHRFPRGEAIEVCTDTAAKLSRAPYNSSFLVSAATREMPTLVNGCVPGEGCC